LLNEEERVVDLAALFDGIPAGEYADWCEKAGEDDEPEAEAIDADMVEDALVAGIRIEINPQTIEFELVARLAEGEVRGQVKREAEADQCRKQGEPGRKLAPVGQDGDEDRAGNGNEKDEREDGLVEVVHAQCPAPWLKKAERLAGEYAQRT